MFASKTDLKNSPIEQVRELWKKAIAEQEPYHNHMTIATSTADGLPSARIVLLKEVRDQGIVFYSNYGSQKGSEISENPKVCAVLYWPKVDIQIRWMGDVEKLSAEDSDRYFASRARESQIGAWASKQSQVIESREWLQEQIDYFEKKYADQDVPRPDYWGGFVIKPQSVHLLERRDHRLHDSYRYFLENDSWKIERLSP